MQTNERRAARRTALVMEGKIVGPVPSPIEFELQDISQTGAKISLSEAAQLPQSFILQIAGNIKIIRVCRLAWRRGLVAGVEFTGRTVKPQNVAFI